MIKKYKIDDFDGITQSDDGYLCYYEDVKYRLEWIPVADQFPPKNRRLLLIDEYGTCYVGYASAFHGEFYTDYNNDIEYVITHWMPLPEPPKEDE